MGAAVGTTGTNVGSTGEMTLTANNGPAHKTTLATASPTDVMMDFMSSSLRPAPTSRVCGGPARFAFHG